MADFNSSVAPVQTAAPLIAPQADLSTAQGINNVSGLLGDIGSTVLGATQQGQQLAIAKAQANINGQFQSNLLRLGDLVDQGAISSQAARIQARQELASQLTNHPLLQEQTNKIYSQSLSDKGMAANLVDGTQAEQDSRAEQTALVEKAQADGFGNPGMDPATQQARLADWQNLQLQAQVMKQQSSALQIAQAKVGLTNANLTTQLDKQSLTTGAIGQQRQLLGLKQETAAYQYSQSVGQVIASTLPKYNDDLAAIQSQVQAGKMSQQDGIAAINTKLQAAQTFYTQQSIQNHSTGDVSVVLSPFNEASKNAIARLDGSVDKTVLDNQQHNQDVLNQMRLTNSSPQFATLAATSAILKNGAGAGLAQAFGTEAVNILTKNGAIPDQNGNVAKPANLNVDTPEMAQAANQYHTVLKAGQQAVNSGTAAPDLKAEVFANTNQHLNSLAVYGPTAANNPVELKQTVQAIADPSYGKYVHDNRSALDQATINKAQQVYENVYKGQLIPLIQQEFTGSNYSVGIKPDALNTETGFSEATADTSQTIHAINRQGVVSFVPNDPNDQFAISKVKQLNANVAPLMNTLVRADAHLNKSVNYNDYADELLQDTIHPTGKSPTPLIDSEVSGETDVDSDTRK